MCNAFTRSRKSEDARLSAAFKERPMADVCIVDDSQTLIESIPQDHTDHCSADSMDFESSISKELINALNQAVLPRRVAELEVADGKATSRLHRTLEIAEREVGHLFLSNFHAAYIEEGQLLHKHSITLLPLFFLAIANLHFAFACRRTTCRLHPSGHPVFGPFFASASYSQPIHYNTPQPSS